MEFVLNISAIMESEDVSLMEDGNLSKEFYRYANKIRNADRKPYPLAMRNLNLNSAVAFKGFDSVK